MMLWISLCWAMGKIREILVDAISVQLDRTDPARRVARKAAAGDQGYRCHACAGRGWGPLVLATADHGSVGGDVARVALQVTGEAVLAGEAEPLAVVLGWGRNTALGLLTGGRTTHAVAAGRG